MSALKLYAVLLILVLNVTTHAQRSDSQEDEKKVKLFPKEYGDKKWKFLFGFDARRSYFKGNPIKINGLKIGAEFKGVHRFGIGFYWLNRNAVFTDIVVNQPDALQPPEVHFDLGYTSIFYERIFLKTRWWEIAFPVHLGAGSITGTYRDTLSAMKPLLRQPFSALLFSTQVKFFPLTWLALRVSGGYRFNFNTAVEVKDAFNRPFYGFGISVNIIDLYKSIKLQHEIRQHKKENRRSDDNDN